MIFIIDDQREFCEVKTILWEKGYKLPNEEYHIERRIEPALEFIKNHHEKINIICVDFRLSYGESGHAFMSQLFELAKKEKFNLNRIRFYFHTLWHEGEKILQDQLDEHLKT